MITRVLFSFLMHLYIHTQVHVFVNRNNTINSNSCNNTPECLFFGGGGWGGGGVKSKSRGI